ncbi:ArsR/SmtB family transcription factor [Streptomyces fuscichromogenes]|uniref:Transcriptional regulator n=1 Tax=Streptomyces fuscichromogenes TaxID=1324013 RepID=A0A917UIN2_9ACTN|nr:winged helix-turn-helix domain-containing protein [Streptomyces fuscichromogenes]GGM92006.1 transcriptional regulator [Streptomyces fuscichromogenes]
MLRIHFTPQDLACVRVASEPDPLWEITCSLHRLQTSRGRWAYADWYRETRATLAGTPLGAAVRRLLVPVLPRARYLPDFLTPHQAADGLDRGLAAIVDTPPERVAHEIQLLDRCSGAPGWAPRLLERQAREDLAGLLRAYHEAVVAPHENRILGTIAAERAVRGRDALAAGVDGLLTGLSPAVRWCPPVLHVDYVEDRDLHLAGRGLRLVPSYFCWQSPVSMADDTLQPLLVYPVHGVRAPAPERPPDASLAALLGRTRAAALRFLALGATTSELARSLGVSVPTATHHTTVLRDAGLVVSRRHHNTVLHSLTPLGAALLRPSADAGTSPG